MPQVPTRSDIEALQREMSRFPQATVETEHFFADGMYCRKVSRKAGTLVVGAVHKKEHFFMVIHGKLSFISEHGRETVEAPHICISKPGTKRVTFAHTDSIAITVHQVSSTDIKEIERELTEDDPSSMYGTGNIPLDNILEHQS